MTNSRTPLGVLVAGVAGFVAVLGAYVALVVTNHEDAANGLIPAVVSLLAAAGVIGHSESRIRQQNETIGKIEHQTNGVLDRRIREGTAEVLRAAGFAVELDDDADQADNRHGWRR